MSEDDRASYGGPASLQQVSSSINRCLLFDGIGARLPCMTHNVNSRREDWWWSMTGPLFATHSHRYNHGPRKSTTHSILYQRTNDNPTNEKGLKKREVAYLLDVNVRTVRRVTRLEAETGSVVQEPVSKGPRRSLNGIDCAVCCIFSIHHGTHTQGFSSILNRY